MQVFNIMFELSHDINCSIRFIPKNRRRQVMCVHPLSSTMVENTDTYSNCVSLINSTGYQIIQNNGQRVYKRPNDPMKPKRGSEIFVGKLPRDLFEDVLVPLFNKIGPIYQLRLMMDFNGRNRGFCFISYYLPQHANSAVSTLNGFEIRPKKRIGVYKSIDNCRLFVGGIPNDKSRAEVRKNFEKYVDGIMDVIMYSSRDNQNQNRGYAFIEFESHRHAAMARRNLSPGSLVLWDVPILVDWADPLPDIDPAVMSQIRKLYIRNLDVNITVEDLKDFLMAFVRPSSISKIYKAYDYAFVHFVTRKSAEFCYKAIIGKMLGCSIIDVMWARPKIYSKSYRASQPVNHFCVSLPPKLRKEVVFNKMMTRTIINNQWSGEYSNYGMDVRFKSP